MIQQPNSKFIVMVLLGEYIRPRGGAFWLSDMLNLLEQLSIGERTARSTIVRMAKEGWFTVEKDGRQSHYTITPYGQNILQGGDWRLEDTVLTDWDGNWHIITYSLPENIRKLRNDLRKQLSWLGYGRLTSGLWLSPHNRQHELDQIITSLNLETYIHFFHGSYIGPLTNPQLIAQCWDLPTLGKQYQAFIHKYKTQTNLTLISPQRSFQTRFWLTVDLFPILRQDPNLPQSLLPPNWIGIQGRDLFNNFRNQLTNQSDVYLNEIIKGEKVGG